MRNHNQIYTLGAPHYKAHFRFFRKFKDFKCALWSENAAFQHKKGHKESNGQTNFLSPANLRWSQNKAKSQL